MSASPNDTATSATAEKTTPFSNRAAAVFMVGLGFVTMVFSGLAMAIAPSGRIASEIGWSFLGLDRWRWESMHLASGLIFTGAGLWHIWLHRSVIRNLLWPAAVRSLGHRRELALAVVLVGGAVLLSIFSLPPVSWLDQLVAWFRRDFW